MHIDNLGNEKWANTCSLVGRPTSTNGNRLRRHIVCQHMHKNNECSETWANTCRLVGRPTSTNGNANAPTRRVRWRWIERCEWRAPLCCLYLICAYVVQYIQLNEDHVFVIILYHCGWLYFHNIKWRRVFRFGYPRMFKINLNNIYSIICYRILLHIR